MTRRCTKRKTLLALSPAAVATLKAMILTHGQTRAAAKLGTSNATIDLALSVGVTAGVHARLEATLGGQP